MSESKFVFLWLLHISVEMVTVSSSPRPTNLDSSVNVKTDTEYLKIAKKGGGHKGKAQ